NDQPSEAPTIPVPSADVEEHNRRVEAKMEALRQKLRHPSATLAASLVTLRSPFVPEVIQSARELGKLKREKKQPPTLPVMVELPTEKRRQTRLMVKGNFLTLGDKVDPAVPAAFHPMSTGAEMDRLGVARWLLDDNN